MKNNFQFESILKNANGDNKAFPQWGNADCRQTWCWGLCPAPFFFKTSFLFIFFKINKNLAVFQPRFFQDLCQFFQIHACKGKPGFHFHPCFSYILRISKSMLFFYYCNNRKWKPSIWTKLYVFTWFASFDRYSDRI